MTPPDRPAAADTIRRNTAKARALSAVGVVLPTDAADLIADVLDAAQTFVTARATVIAAISDFDVRDEAYTALHTARNAAADELAAALARLDAAFVQPEGDSRA